MAELQVSRKGGKARTAPRIDLTPMVDLGFLLITFFMMTTRMSEPKALDISMPYKPADEREVTAFYESSAITLIPTGGHKVYYYEGLYDPTRPMKRVQSNDEPALRQVLATKQKQIANRADARERELQVLIKPTDEATLEDIISLLDEMRIHRTRYYALTDITPEELQHTAGRR